MDNCSENENFRLAVKRTRPKTLEEAVTAAMQEECIRITESKNPKDKKDYKPQVYEVQDPKKGDHFNSGRQLRENSGIPPRKCFNCNSTRHLVRDCPNTNGNRQTGTGSSVTGRVRDGTTQSKALNRDRPRQ